MFKFLVIETLDPDYLEVVDPDLDPQICAWLRACFVWQGGGGEPAGQAAAARGAPQLGGDRVPPEPAQQQVVPPQGEVRAQEGGAHQRSQCTGIQSSFTPSVETRFQQHLSGFGSV